jgi:hypothetical protein
MKLSNESSIAFRAASLWKQCLWHLRGIEMEGRACWTCKSHSPLYSIEYHHAHF